MLDIWIDSRRPMGARSVTIVKVSGGLVPPPQLMIAQATVPVLSYPMPRRWISDAARRNREPTASFYFVPMVPFQGLIRKRNIYLSIL